MTLLEEAISQEAPDDNTPCLKHKIMDLKTSLRQLLTGQPGKNLAQIARDADVPYWPLFYFDRGSSQTLDVDHAHKLYTHLTGKKWTVEPNDETP